MCDQRTADYEAIAYTNNAFPASHPSTLAMVAELHGLDAPALDGCRLLELGCGRGGNLLPMAEGMPASKFVGIDLSPRQIGEANSARAQLGLENISFHTMDLVELGDQFGKFDFIVAHGVYSWVPAKVQNALLALCRDRLAANGVAYISYNTLPGWHYRGVVRDLLRQHLDHNASPHEQVAQARSLLDFMIASLPDQEGIRTKLVIDECTALKNQADGYIYHDHLEPDNHPCYFHEFVDNARKRDLEFVAEAQPNPLVEALDSKTLQSVHDMTGEAPQREQLIDFLTHRTFRRSVLCHAGRSPDPTPNTNRIRGFFLTSSSHPAGGDARDLNGPLTFQTSAGDAMTTNHPLVKTALVTLYETGPTARSFADVVVDIADRLTRAKDAALASELEHVLLAVYRRGAIQLYVNPPSFCPTVTERPLASGVARLQAAGDSRVTNRQHRSIGLNEIDRFLLMCMDGESDQDAMVTLLEKEVRDGKLNVEGVEKKAARDNALFFQQLFLARANYLAASAFLIG